MKKSIENYNKVIGKKIIQNAIRREEALIGILRMEVKILKILTKDDTYNYANIQKSNRIIRYILFSLTVIDERIQTGLELIMNKDD